MRNPQRYTMGIFGPLKNELGEYVLYCDHLEYVLELSMQVLDLQKQLHDAGCTIKERPYFQSDGQNSVRINELIRQKNMLAEQNCDLVRSLDSSKAHIDSLEKNVDALISSNKERDEQIEKNRIEIYTHERNLSAINDSYTVYVKENRQQREQISELKKKIEENERVIELMKNNELSNKLVEVCLNLRTMSELYAKVIRENCGKNFLQQPLNYPSSLYYAINEFDSVWNGLKKPKAEQLEQEFNKLKQHVERLNESGDAMHQWMVNAGRRTWSRPVDAFEMDKSMYAWRNAREEAP